ncbi:hypothetical protein [Sphingomonas sp. OTU376]|uniref:hypothetical protein n=1 Tax=Sphingomonas sp. OTU376 TaxID=3043863 RepID=UPI00313EB3A5
MHVLDQDLARRRAFYARPVPTLPDILVINVPARFAGPGLALEHFYPVMIETEREHREFRALLAAERPSPVVPDLLDHRPSQLVARGIVIASYDPPCAGWPFVLLCHWPASYTSMVRDPAIFARGAYTTEMFDTLDALADASARLLSVLGARNALDVHFVPGAAGPVGRA